MYKLPSSSSVFLIGSLRMLKKLYFVYDYCGSGSNGEE